MSITLHAVPQQLDFHQLERMLPFGKSWQQIDRMLSWNDSEIVVQKSISGGDPNMSAHLKDGPSIMPGVLQIELVGQAILLLMIILNTTGRRSDGQGGAGVLGRCKGQFHSPASIGETITATARIVEASAGKVVYKGIITCGARQVSTIDGIGSLISAQSPEALHA